MSASRRVLYFIWFEPATLLILCETPVLIAGPVRRAIDYSVSTNLDYGSQPGRIWDFFERSKTSFFSSARYGILAFLLKYKTSIYKKFLV